MARLPNPFSDSDFAVGPRTPFEGPDATPTPQPTPPPTLPGLGGALPPPEGFPAGQPAQRQPTEGPSPFEFEMPGEGTSASDKYKVAVQRMRTALSQYAVPGEFGQYQTNPMAKAAYDSALADANFYRNQMQDEIEHQQARAERAEDRAESRAAAAESRALSLALKQMDQQFQGAQAEADRAFRTGERIGGQEFQTGERLGGQEFQTGQTILTDQLARQRAQEQRAFEAEENALNRKLQELQLGITAGRLNLDTALGVLEKWLQSYQYSMPEGAQYTPGFQPGGAFQQASKLAGVSYNPANYRANTVPFDPAAVVRQTLGGG